MPLLLLRIVHFLVLPLSKVLLLHAALAVSVEGRRPFKFAAVSARRTLRLSRALPALCDGERVPGQVAQRPAHRDLGAAHLALIIEGQIRLLAAPDPRIRVVEILLYMLLEHAIVREILLEQRITDHETTRKIKLKTQPILNWVEKACRGTIIAALGPIIRL